MVVNYFLSFFNATILPILITIRLSPKEYPLLSRVFSRGQFEDFSQGWYDEVGHMLVKTMKAQVLLPLIILAASILSHYLSLWIDRSCRCRDRYRTKQKTVYRLSEKLSGSDFKIGF